MVRGRRSSLNYQVVDPKIRELYDEDELSLNEIARRLVLHPQIVKRRCEAMGLDVRGISEAMVLFHQNRKGDEENGEGEGEESREAEGGEGDDEESPGGSETEKDDRDRWEGKGPRRLFLRRRLRNLKG